MTFKKILISLAVVVGAVALALMALVLFVDVNPYKPQIEAAVKDHTGRALTINGDLRLSLFPRIGLSLPETTLSDVSGARIAAQVKSAHVSVGLFPLLQGRLVVGQVAVDGLDATLVRNADGSTNFDDLIKPSEKPSEDTAQGPATPLLFEVGGIALTNSALTIEDHQNETELRLNKLNFKSGRLATQSAAPIALDVAFTNTHPNISGTLVVKGTVDIDRVAQAYGMRDVRLTLDAVAGSGVNAQPLRLSLGVTRLSAHSVEAGSAYLTQTLDVTAEGAWGAWVFDKSYLRADTLEYNPMTLDVNIQALDMHVRGQRGTEHFDLSARAPKFFTSHDQASGEAVEAALKWSGAPNSTVRSLDAKLHMREISGYAQALSVAGLALSMDAALANPDQSVRKVRAQLSGPLRMDLKQKAFSFPLMSGELGVEDAALFEQPMRVPLDWELKIDLTQRVVAGRFKARLDGGVTTAITQIRDLGIDGRQHIDVKIVSERLNLDRYLSSSQTKKTTAQASKESDTPVDLSVLKGLNLEADLRVFQLQAAGVKASDVHVKIKAANDQLDVEPIKASLYGGLLNGHAAADAAHHVSLNLALHDVDVGPLVKDLFKKDVLSGFGDVGVSLSSEGQSVDAMKKALNGKVALVLTDVAVHGVDLEKILRETVGLGSGGAQSKPTKSGDRTELTDLSAQFLIKDGVATNRDLLGISPWLRVTGEGQIDVARARMDYITRVTVTGPDGVEGNVLNKLRGRTIPVRIKGPFDQLAYRVEVGEAAKEAAKAKAREKIEEELAPKIKEQTDALKSRLKGLFGQ